MDAIIEKRKMKIKELSNLINSHFHLRLALFVLRCLLVVRVVDSLVLNIIISVMCI